MSENLVLFLLLTLLPAWLWLREPLQSLVIKMREQDKFKRVKGMTDAELLDNGIKRFNEGIEALEADDTKKAADLFMESILCLRQTSDLTQLGHACYGMAKAERAQGKIDSARRYYTEARVTANRIKDRAQEIKVLLAMAELETDQKTYPYARSAFLQAIKLIQQAGELEQEAHAFIKLSDMELEAGKPDRAVTYLEAASRIANKIGNDGLQADCLLRATDIQRGAAKSAATQSA